MLEVPDDGERESVSRIVAATVREVLGDPDPSVSVRTLAISDGPGCDHCCATSVRQWGVDFGRHGSNP